MSRLHLLLKHSILHVVDFFYPLFGKIMPLQTFRYAACGGGNMLLSMVLYPVIYNFVLRQQVVHITRTLAFTPHIASLFLAFLITFPIGFYLSMFVVFPGSELPKRTQLFRYLMVVFGCLMLNYFLMKLFVGVFHWWSTPSYYLNVLLVTAFSYFSQRHFSFKGNQAVTSKK